MLREVGEVTPLRAGFAVEVLTAEHLHRDIAGVLRADA